MSIYVSDRRDLDILYALADIPEGDRSWYLKELIRDGLRYRNGIEPPVSIVGRSTQVIVPGAPPTVPQQVTPKATKKKKVVQEEPKKEPEVEQEVIVESKPEPVIVPQPIVKPVEEERPPVTPVSNPMDIFANIDLEALKKQAEEEIDDDDIDARLDDL